MEVTGLPSGTVYPALRRMERDKLIRSHWERQSIADAELRPPRTKETTLRDDLRQLRNLIDQYTADKKKAPQSLQDLVDAGYLRTLPIDTFTMSNTTWEAVTNTSVAAPDQTES